MDTLAERLWLVNGTWEQPQDLDRWPDAGFLACGSLVKTGIWHFLVVNVLCCEAFYIPGFLLVIGVIESHR